MTTTARAAVAALALAAVIAGCGRGDGTEEVAVVEDLDLMQAVEAAGTARMSVVVDAEVPADGEDAVGGPMVRFVVDIEGVVAFDGSESTWSGTWSVAAVLPEGAIDVPLEAPPSRVEEVTTPDGRWTRFWTEGDEPPAWEEVDPFEDEEALEGGDDGLLASPFAMDPTQFLDRLREEADSVTRVGDDEVRGAAATRYRAEVDAESLDLPGLGEGGNATVDVWVDSEERLRRVEAGGAVLELWDFGTPVEAVAPTDIADPDGPGPDIFGPMPEVTGEWAAVATGTAGTADWTVFAAEAEVLDTPTTCRTLEIEAEAEAEAGAGAGAADPFDDVYESFSMVAHEGALATCGSSTVALAFGGIVAEPAIQVLTARIDLAAELGGGDLPDAAPAGADLIGFVVAPDRAGDGTITLVRDGADPVVLELDPSGIAVWDGAGPAPVTAIELDGGAVRCAVVGPADGEDDDGSEAGGTGLGLLPPVCVRA